MMGCLLTWDKQFCRIKIELTFSVSQIWLVSPSPTPIRAQSWVSDPAVGTGASLDSSRASKPTRDIALWLNLLCDYSEKDGQVIFSNHYAARLDVTWLSRSSEQSVLCCDLFFVGESALASCHARWRWWASAWKFDDVPARERRANDTKVFRTIKKGKKQKNRTFPSRREERGAETPIRRLKGVLVVGPGRGWERNNSAQMIAGQREWKQVAKERKQNRHSWEWSFQVLLR